MSRIQILLTSTHHALVRMSGKMNLIKVRFRDFNHFDETSPCQVYITTGWYLRQMIWANHSLMKQRSVWFSTCCFCISSESSHLVGLVCLVQFEAESIHFCGLAVEQQCFHLSQAEPRSSTGVWDVRLLQGFAGLTLQDMANGGHLSASRKKIHFHQMKSQIDMCGCADEVFV